MDDRDKRDNDISRRGFIGLAGVAGLTLLSGVPVWGVEMDKYDLVIKNGRLIDPESNTDAFLNIGISSGKVVAISKDVIRGKKTIDATGLVVSPGFIDVHTHVDGLLHAGRSMARMGATTAVGGNCGFAYIPEKTDVGVFLGRIDRDGFPINHAYLVGASALREWAGIEPGEKAREYDIEKMANAAEEAIEGGAVGISFGIEYHPGTSRRELTTLFDVAYRKNSRATVHPRHTGRGFPLIQPDAVTAYEELTEATKDTGASLQISHLGSQLAWRSNPYDELMKRGFEVIEKARDRGFDVYGDAYPYDAWCTLAGSPNLGYFLKGGLVEYLVKNRYYMDIGMLEVGSGPYKGESLTKELLRQLRDEEPGTWIIGHTMEEALIEKILKEPYVCVASDGVFDIETGIPTHPRGAGTFPRFLRDFVTEKRYLTLIESLRKMTIMPALRFGFEDKGKISPGADADITIFDPKTISDNATYMEPDLPPTGVDYVIVGGIPVVERGEMRDVMPGRAVRGN